MVSFPDYILEEIPGSWTSESVDIRKVLNPCDSMWKRKNIKEEKSDRVNGDQIKDSRMLARVLPSFLRLSPNCALGRLICTMSKTD